MRTAFAIFAPLLFVAVSCGSSGTAPTDPAGFEADAEEESADAGGVIAKDETAAASTVSPREAAAKTAEPAKDDRPRIGALGPHTWIWKRPSRDGLAIGKMRIGTSVVLKSAGPVDGPGCRGKWYAIEPRGYVCDDNTATVDLDDPWFKALAYSAPKPGEWPYRYAHSNGAPMYGRVPTPEEWKITERDYGPVNTWKPLGAWAKGHEENIVDDPIKATDEVPYFLKDGKRTAPGGNFNTAALVWKKIPAGSMLAYSRAFEMHGRVWLLTPDTMVVPADRVSHMKESTFKGVHFDKSSMRLPFAWNRSKGLLPKYRRGPDGKMAPTNETLAAKTPIEITGEEVVENGMAYFELRKERGTYMGRTSDASKALDIDLVITRAATELPKGTDKDEKWLEAKILNGTLTAYVGLEPVMTTLFSPGKGGAPPPTYKFPDDHSKYATTALGNFPLEWKERVATMSNEKGEPKVLWFTDVPHQQYLRAPLAMHVAYWHEDYGKRKSAECLNVSPLDGLWLFGWTLPVLPEGWNAVGAGQGNGESTVVFVGTK